MTVELLRWNFRRAAGTLGQPCPPSFFGGNARCEPNLHRGQIGGIGEIEDRPDHPVDLLGGDRPQRDLADQEQVAGLVEGEAEHVAGRLAEQQVAVEPLALLLGGAHEERLHPQGAVAHGQVDADAELALAGQAQEPTPVAQLLGGHVGIGDEAGHRRHRRRPHLVRFRSSVHKSLRLPWGTTTDEGWEARWRPSGSPGCASGTARWRPSAASTSRSPRVSASRCWDRTGPARRPPWRSWKAIGTATPARSRCWASTRRGAGGTSASGSGSCSSPPATSAS